MAAILFFDDYSEGAHPKLLAALSATNLQQQRGYSADHFTDEAQHLIREKIQQPAAAVHFVASGTQANLVSLVSLLKPYESVIAAENGHISVHEAGAIEATGHKINVVNGQAGKVTVESIQTVLDEHTDEHKVKPKVVYISQATELGTIYRLEELQKLSSYCRLNDLYLFIDGARIGNAVMSPEADFGLAEIAQLSDIFTLGGTKNGALLGEAIIIVNPLVQSGFSYHLRQRGALLAKARTVSVQFRELFNGNLYFDNAAHANKMAKNIADGIQECGYSLLHPPATNQIFPILPNSLITHLQQKYGFYLWSKAPNFPDSTVIRLVCSWATPETAVQEFLHDLRNFP